MKSKSAPFSLTSAGGSGVGVDVGVAVGIGVVVAIFQAATQINEMTMTFVPKILTVFTVLILTLPWAISQLTGFATDMFLRIANM